MTTKAQNERLKKDLSEKIRLEKIFIKEIKSLFARLNKDSMLNILLYDATLPAEKYQSEWEALLRKHYTRVQSAFSGNVEELLAEGDKGLSNVEEVAIIAALLWWRDNRAELQAKIITDTTNRQLTKSIIAARELLAEQKIEITKASTARTTAAIFKKGYSSRVANISATETQSAAESTKMMEAANLSGVEPQNIYNPSGLDVKSTKEWSAVGDSKTRKAHSDVSGTSILINEIFIVGGESMLHPGDATLGATAKNLAYCRCALLYTITRIRR